jgi:hypothetical protein
LVVVLAPPLSVTVAPAITAPPEELVTTPVTAPVVGMDVSAKLMFGVVCPALTMAVRVCGLNPLAVAVRVWLPGASPETVYTPDPLVVAVPLTLSVTVAPEIAAPPEAFVTLPLTDPGVGVSAKFTFAVVWPALTVAARVCEL